MAKIKKLLSPKIEILLNYSFISSYKIYLLSSQVLFYWFFINILTNIVNNATIKNKFKEKSYLIKRKYL